MRDLGGQLTMRVLYVTIFTIPHVGGLSEVLLSEAENMAKYHDVSVICPESGSFGVYRSALRRTQIQVSYVRFIPVRSFIGRLMMAIQIARMIKTINKNTHVDVVSAHDVYGGIASIIAGFGRSSMLTLHLVYSRGRFGYERVVSLRRRAVLKLEFLADCILEVFCYNLVRGIVCVSEREKDDSLEKTICKSKIFLARNAIDPNKMKVSRSTELRASYGFDENNVVFLFWGE